MEEKLFIASVEVIRRALLRLNFSVKLLELQISSGLNLTEKLFQELLEDKGIKLTKINEELEKSLQEQRLEIEANLDKLAVISLKLQGASSEEIVKILANSEVALEESTAEFRKTMQEMRLEQILASVDTAKKGN